VSLLPAILRPVRIYVTGPVTVEAGQTIIHERDLPGSQGRTVLAMLTVEHRRPLSRDQLADELWPDRLPRSFQTALRAIVSKIRAALAAGGAGHDLIGNAFGCYQFRLPPDGWLDSESAARALHAAQTDLARGKAMTASVNAIVTCLICSRPFLAGVYSPWVCRQRVRLANLHVEARECLAEALAQTGDFADAARSAEAALMIDPYRETPHQLLIRSRALAGDRTGAARAFARYRELLGRELGIGPTPETVAIYQESLAARRQPTPPRA
jgi:DNA-binding SARP family transcriptional activator